MFINWILAFGITQLIEVPIYSHALNGRIFTAFGASLLTHPIIWFLFPLMPLENYWLTICASEVFTLTVEAFYLKFFGLKKAWIWSLVANSISCFIGLVYYYSKGYL